MKKYLLVLISLLILFLHGCASAPSSRTISLRELKLNDLCQSYNLQWQYDSINQVVTLSRGGMTAKALIGSNVVVLDDQKVFLSQPLRRKRQNIYVSSDFKQRVIDRFIQRRFSYPSRKFSKIVIDAGHGGKDPGAIGYSGLKEKEVTLDIARKLKAILSNKGIQVTMTRRNDQFISLEDRAKISNNSKSDLFVSIHANAAHTKGVKGFEVFCLRSPDYETKREIQEAKSYRYMFQKLKMEDNNKILDEILYDMLYNYKRAESYRLAEYIARKTSRELNLRNRGCKRSGFFVLKHTAIPAVLVEVGFLSNKKEEKLLKDNQYRQKVANSIAESILEYEKIN